MDIKTVEVSMFGKKVKAVFYDGAVQFEKQGFVNAIGKERAQRIFTDMALCFQFMGEDGADWLISQGREHMLCSLVLMDPNTSEELKEYATAWATAVEMLRVTDESC